MSSTRETVCPKCGATEIKNLSWLRTLCVSLFFLSAVVQLVWGFVLFQGVPIWNGVRNAGINVVCGILFWFLLMRVQKWRCTKCKHSW